MNADEVVRTLRAVEEKHKNDFVPTFEIRISDMARDCADVIESLQAENARLRRERDALLADLRGDCASCAHRDENAKSDICQTCPQPGGAGFGNWEWRGAMEDKPRACVENGKE